MGENYTHTGALPSKENVEMHKHLSAAMEILRPHCACPEDLLVNLTVAAFATGVMGAGKISSDDLEGILAAISGSICDQIILTNGVN